MIEESVRVAALSIWDVLQLGKQTVFDRKFPLPSRGHSLKGILDLLAYASAHPGTKRKVSMDVGRMVGAWVPIIKGLATAHTKAEVDGCEFQMEKHLAPLLTAPVKQIRRFFSELCKALKSDKEVPFFVWAVFEAYHKVVVKEAPDGELVQLKTGLATEIARMVEEDVAPDIPRAIAGALQWRSPVELESLKKEIEKGESKPQLVGKESCLFLEVGDRQVML